MEIRLKTVDNNSEKSLNGKWDKCLDDYNDYTKKYIKHYKKSLDGNSVSLTKFPDMKLRSEILYKSLFDAQKSASLTEKQIRRMHKIQMKIANPCLT